MFYRIVVSNDDNKETCFVVADDSDAAAEKAFDEWYDTFDITPEIESVEVFNKHTQGWDAVK